MSCQLFDADFDDEDNGADNDEADDAHTDIDVTVTMCTSLYPLPTSLCCPFIYNLSPNLLLCHGAQPFQLLQPGLAEALADSTTRSTNGHGCYSSSSLSTVWMSLLP